MLHPSMCVLNKKKVANNHLLIMKFTDSFHGCNVRLGMIVKAVAMGQDTIIPTMGLSFRFFLALSCSSTLE